MISHSMQYIMSLGTPILYIQKYIILLNQLLKNITRLLKHLIPILLNPQIKKPYELTFSNL